MARKRCILRVAIATPLRRLFDYLPAADTVNEKLHPGTRVSVPFGKRKEVTGLIIEIADNTGYPLNKLKRIHCVIDNQPVIANKHLQFLLWSSRYYHHPVGEVMFNALPSLLRKGKSLNYSHNDTWLLSEKTLQLDFDTLKISDKQLAILKYFKVQGTPVAETDLSCHFSRYKTSLAVLEKQGLIKKVKNQSHDQHIQVNKCNLNLNKQQQHAIKNISASLDKHSIYLLDGVTGSGKTEVYMAVIEKVIQSGKQCLILLPEIGLTPQLIQRFKDRFNTEIALQHSGLADTERLGYWQSAKTGAAKLILGTRSAVWTPLLNPGLYIIDEEHDLSYKQQDSFRYSARDMLLIRAKRDKVPVILGSATPSLESIYNVKKNKYEHLVLSLRAGKSIPPEFRLLDIRGKKMHGPLSQVLVDEIEQHIDANRQVLLFLNRRGYANHLFCHQCGWKAECPRCELPYTYHKSKNRLICHHCESNKIKMDNCPECNETLLLLGHGTERIEEQLEKLYPTAKIVRIDRDTTRKKGSMSNILEKIHSGDIDILIGTQMLAKGHHFPNVTLTAIVDADRGLFSTDFRASERLAQLFIQVSGRTGRGENPGQVIVQTYNPDHPLFHQLINKGYGYFSDSLLNERKQASLPPFSYIAFLRAEAHNDNDVKHFLNHAAIELKNFTNDTLHIFGPIPALIEKRIGRFRFQLIIQSTSRNKLHQYLDEWLLKLEQMKMSKKVRWSLDIDPQDMS